MSFDKYLSEQGKKKTQYSTPMQDISKAGQIHDQIFGTGRDIRPVSQNDWKRLDEAQKQARVAENFFRDGTYDKAGN
jgi:hypothetical protein